MLGWILFWHLHIVHNTDRNTFSFTGGIAISVCFTFNNQAAGTRQAKECKDILLNLGIPFVWISGYTVHVYINILGETLEVLCITESFIDKTERQRKALLVLTKQIISQFI